MRVIIRISYDSIAEKWRRNKDRVTVIPSDSDDYCVYTAAFLRPCLSPHPPPAYRANERDIIADAECEYQLRGRDEVYKSVDMIAGFGGGRLVGKCARSIAESSRAIITTKFTSYRPRRTSLSSSEVKQ